MKYRPKQSKDTVYQGRTLDIIHRSASPDKIRSIEFEFAHRPAIVIVIPFLSPTAIIMIRQYRASINAFIWEFPAGTVEEGETIEDAALRELEEEVGYRSHELKLVKEFYTSPHFSDEKAFLFIAKQLHVGKQELQEKEFITVHPMTYDELQGKYNNNELIDAKTLVAYGYIIEKGTEVH